MAEEIVPPTKDRGRFPLLLAGVGLAGWAFWPTLQFLFGKWVNDPQYSHGFLVPLFAGYYLWRSAGESPTGWFSAPRPMTAAGVLAFAAVCRGIAGAILFHQLDALAMLLSLAALTLAVGGAALFKRTAPAILFLGFMIPLPYELERNVGGPLRIAATASSTFLLQTLGQPAVSEGNVILLDEHKLEVADACNGLKMLVTFAAFSVGAVLLARRSWFEKAMLLLGIVPVAIVTNVLRITATGIAFTFDPNKSAMHTLHDAFGWLMMPVGLGLLACELWALNRLVKKC
ncbi:MAG TPA: exosortase/archaeosortase family protein [Fimbriiglobus sp.]|jgi:exosortase